MNVVIASMCKMVADRENLGIGAYYLDENGNITQDTLPSHQNTQVGRKYCFLFSLLTFANKLDLYVWDKALFLNEASGDTYGAIPALYKMLKDSGCVSSYLSMTPLLWNSEYSLDDGTTWLKTKGIDWDLSTTDVLAVRSMVSDTEWILTAYRPEGFEPLEFMARAEIGGIMRYAEVTQNSWDTTNENYGNVDLEDIPNQHKDYYCNKFTY